MDKTRIEKFALGGGRVSYRGALHVGLVNAMPDALMRTTELQFARLLKEASGAPDANPLDVRLHLFSLPQIARGEAAASRMEGFYANADSLPDAGLDALIVARSEAEDADIGVLPCWDAFRKLVDWADGGVVSTYFTGPAAQAAVLHLDSIAWRRLPRKLSGVFVASRAQEHALHTGLPRDAHVPHARHHDVPESALTARGYQVLSRMDQGGVDFYARRNRSLFLFAQGQPEQDAGMLAREYLGEMDRFLRGEGARASIPENYFDRMTEDQLQDLGDGAADDLARYRAVAAGAVPFTS